MADTLPPHSEEAELAVLGSLMIDPDAGVYPMVGPGQSYDEMITGDHIASRNKVDAKTPGASEMF